jgi:hypothetical protein
MKEKIKNWSKNEIIEKEEQYELYEHIKYVKKIKIN